MAAQLKVYLYYMTLTSFSLNMPVSQGLLKVTGVMYLTRNLFQRVRYNINTLYDNDMNNCLRMRKESLKFEEVPHRVATADSSFTVLFFPMALQPQFGTWPTSMKLSISLRFSRS
jgi:hypothetical protein